MINNIGVYFNMSMFGNHSEDIDVDVKIILERILRKWGWKLWISCI
jgi:hypothetical protein